MIQFRTGLILSALILTVFMMSAFMPQEVKKAKNLKVLPKNISHEDLDKIMDGFTAGLGVKCNFCHVPQKDNPKRLDFASDEKPEKDVARAMIKMTIRINKKDFHVKNAYNGNAVLAVSCVTCHNGNAHPKAD